MSVIKIVNINITGQVSDDYNDREYEVLLAKIKVLAAEYGLTVEQL